MTTSHVLAEIAWDPEIRNILALMVGVIVLFGSVILIVSTNTGPRTGLLIGLAAFFGWMTIMGVVWWMYGIGPKGQAPRWRALEINRGDLTQASTPQARKLPELDEQQLVRQILAKYPDLESKVVLPGQEGKVIAVSELVEADPALKDEFRLNASDLGGWRILVPSDKQRGDAQATADAALLEAKLFKASSDYKVVEAYDVGGKRQLAPGVGDCKWYSPGTYGDCKTRVWDNIYSVIQFTNPQHFAIVQVQAVIPQETKPGAAPPPAKFDPSAPVYSVVLIRDQGFLRLPSAIVTIVFGILFGLTCWVLHRRDKIVAANRAAAA